MERIELPEPNDGSPQPATVKYTDDKEVMKRCAACGNEVPHKVVEVVGGLLSGQKLYRPWPHCTKCGTFRPPTDFDDRCNRIHISCDCED